ncbi:MAG: alpha/beta hydrolase-fold protein [Verrucomicrobiota bacterium]
MNTNYFSPHQLFKGALLLTGLAILSSSAQGQAPKTPWVRPAPLISPEVQASGDVMVRFRAPKASDVKVAGQFGATTNLTKDEQGIWSVLLRQVPAGVHEYHFVVDGLSVLDAQNSFVKPQRYPSSSVMHVPANPPALWDWQEIPHGTLHIHEYHSKALGKMRRVFVYTPPGAEGAGPLPVLYLSHGNGDNEATWTTHGKAHWILDALIAQKKSQLMILVMPDAHAVPPRGGVFEEYSVDNTEAYCRELVEDVIPLVESNYKVNAAPAARAFAGLSMGGHHAFSVALNLHEKFAYVGAFSAVPPEPKFVAGGLDDPEATNKDLKLFWSACGKKDFLRERNEDFNTLLKQKGIRFEFVETEGDHSWPVWRRYLAEFAPKLFQNP